jgi:periplasmic protein TonB
LASQVDSGRSTASPPANPVPSSKKNVLAHEVRVIATGARPSGDSGERELFTEETTSVLVFENGGVIRLSAAVIPGQLLFLTNQESKREVVAQVTHKRNNRPTSCYVELEFTESSPGFWGVEIPKSTEPSPAPSPENVKHMEIAELVHSADRTSDDPDVPARVPDAQEVERLKNEVEALRKQLESLREAQRAAAPPAVAVASNVSPPVFPQAAPADGEPPSAAAPSSPLTISREDVVSEVPPAASAKTEVPPVEVPPVTVSPKPLSVSTPVVTVEAPSPKPTVESPESARAEEDILPKPSLDFDKAAAKAARSRHSAGASVTRVAQASSGATRRRFLLVALLLVMIGAAWSMNWLPWLPPMKNILPGASSSLGRGPYSTSAAPAVTPKTSATLPGKVATKQPGETSSLPPGSAPRGSQSIGATPNAASTPGPASAISASKERESSSLVEKPSPSASAPKQILLRSSNKTASASASATPDASGFLPPKLVRSVRPVVPPQALRNFVTGNVTVDATVDSAGHVKAATALSGPETLRKAAVDTVKRYRYQPALQNGKPVPAHVQVIIQFWFEP